MGLGAVQIAPRRDLASKRYLAVLVERSLGFRV